MLFKKLNTFLLFVLVCSACSMKNRKEHQSLFDETVPLSTLRQQEERDDVYMRYPYRVRLDDSLLYVMDLHAPEAYCHQFTYPDLAYIRSFAVRGNEPKTFLAADNMRLDKDGHLSILDANRHLIAHIDTDDGTLLAEWALPPDLIRTLDFVALNESLFIVPDYTGSYRYSLVGKNGSIVRNVGEIPKDKKEKSSGVALAQGWRAFIDYNERNGVLAMATQLGQVLEIYDVPNDTIVSVAVGECGRPVFDNRSGYAIPNGIMGYGDVQVGDKYIYVLFWGTSFEEIRKGESLLEGGNLVEVFDLKGNPVLQYQLDRNISGFFIVEEEQKMIALDVNSDQPIVEYELTGLY